MLKILNIKVNNDGSKSFVGTYKKERVSNSNLQINRGNIQ